MAFSPNKLSVLAYADGFTLWHYKSTGSIEATAATNFWSGDAKRTLHDGDIVIASCSDGFTIMKVKNDDSFVPASKSVVSE